MGKSFVAISGTIDARNIFTTNVTEILIFAALEISIYREMDVNYEHFRLKKSFTNDLRGNRKG